MHLLDDMMGLLDDIAQGVKTPEANPLLDLYIRHNCYEFVPSIHCRGELVASFAWAIPDDYAISAICELRKPIVEVGAGTGYWARLLARAGADVVAYDNSPPHLKKNGFFSVRTSYFPVRRRGRSIVRKHPDRALFLCWPPYDTPFATDVLRAYQGDTLIFVGEGRGGCTGDEAFFAEMEKWKQDTVVRIPQFHGIHDYLQIFRR